MRGDLWRIALGAVGALILFWLVSLGLEKWRLHQVAKTQTAVVTVDKNQAVHVAQADVHEQQLRDLQAALARSRVEVARAKAQVQTVTVAVPEPVQETPKNEHDERDVLIQAQDTHIQNLEAALKAATARGDAYKLALEDATKRANLQEAALKAALAAQVASKWRGRVEGFAVGIGVGYIGGRLK